MTAQGKWGILLAAALLSLVVAIPIAYAHEWAYADSFPEQSYNNNTGSLIWDGPWQEIGESDGPGSGVVSVSSSGCSGKCLLLNAPISLVVDKGVWRGADLTDAEYAELQYKIKRETSLLPVGNLYVQMRKAGQSWNTIKTHSLSTADSSSVPYTFDVSGYAGHNVELRFLLDSVSLNVRVSVDDVELGIEYPETTTSTTTASTTTSTTKPAPTTTTTTKPTSTTSSTSSTTSSTTSTTFPGETSPTNTTLPDTTTTTRGETESDDLPVSPSGQSQPPTDSGALTAGATGSLAADIATARAFGISLDMSPVGNARYDRMLGLNPLTSLAASFRSVVEAIQNEYLSALALAFMVAFFAVRMPGTDEDKEIPRSDGSIGQ